jgi:DNA-binding transcriptional regulator YiaG
MPNIAVVFKQEISRLARKEVRSQTQGLHKAAAQYRRDIAELKRHASKLQTVVARLERQVRKGASPLVTETDAQGIRFAAKGVRSQRKRLGISAADYAKLVGVTAHTIYKWEHGAARPRKRQLTALASLRRVGKKEALDRLQQRARKSSKGRKNTR